MGNSDIKMQLKLNVLELTQHGHLCLQTPPYNALMQNETNMFRSLSHFFPWQDQLQTTGIITLSHTAVKC